MLNLALLQGGLAASHSNEIGSGTLWMLGAEHQSMRNGITFHYEGASTNYRRVGQNDLLPPTKTQALFSYSYTGGFGQTGFAYAHLNSRDTGNVDSFTGNLSLRLGEKVSLLFSATHFIGRSTGNGLSATLIVPLDGRLVASASAFKREGQTSSYVAASNPLGTEAGFGRVVGGIAARAAPGNSSSTSRSAACSGDGSVAMRPVARSSRTHWRKLVCATPISASTAGVTRRSSSSRRL